jgi:hypothetical protein
MGSTMAKTMSHHQQYAERWFRRLPNPLFDLLGNIDLSEFTVLLAVWKVLDDADQDSAVLTASQLAKATGICTRSIKTHLKNLRMSCRRPALLVSRLSQKKHNGHPLLEWSIDWPGVLEASGHSDQFRRLRSHCRIPSDWFSSARVETHGASCNGPRSLPA